MELLDELARDHDDIARVLRQAERSGGSVGALTAVLAARRSVEHEVLYPVVRRHLDDGDRMVDQLVGRQERLAAFASELERADRDDRADATWAVDAAGAIDAIDPVGDADRTVRSDLSRRFVEVLQDHRRLLTETVVPDLAARLSRQELSELAAQVRDRRVGTDARVRDRAR